MMLRRVFDSKLIHKVILFSFVIGLLFRVFMMRADASERADLQYYGDFIHEYDLYLATSDGGYDKLHVTTDGDTYPILIYFTNWKSLRLIYFQFGSSNANAFAYDFSNDFGNHNFRTFTMTYGIQSSEPYFRYNNVYQTTNNQNLPINCNWYVEGLPLFISSTLQGAVYDYLNCVNIWYEDQKGGSINADVTVDTTNIENLIKDSNAINQSTDSSVKVIETALSSSSSSVIGGLSDDDRTLLKRYDIWLVLICFGVLLTLFTNRIHQLGRNIRGR